MPHYNRTRRACFFTYLALSPVFALPPMLFVTFHQMYGISYTLLGSLLLVNFSMQLGVDLLFTFFSKHFNIKKTVRILPLITAAGLLIYSLVPLFAPEAATAGLLIGTCVFSVGSGLAEVLLSPLVAAIPSKDPTRDMTRLHSLYGWGLVSVVAVSALYFALFGTERWAYLVLFWAIFPLVASFLFSISPIPPVVTEPTKRAGGSRRGLALCVALIFLGAAAENTMTGWISNYMEQAIGVSKTVGDLVGMAAFALMLTLGRILYAKRGGDMLTTLLIGMIASAVLYGVAGFSGLPILSFAACVLVGFATSMLWPGTVILMEERFPALGVAAYALMAAGGDLGAAAVPQLTGAIVDAVAASPWAAGFAGLTPEAVGLRVGMVTAALFPLIGIGLIFIMKKVLPPKTAKAE